MTKSPTMRCGERRHRIAVAIVSWPPSLRLGRSLKNVLTIIARLFGAASPDRGDGLRLGSVHGVGVEERYGSDRQATRDHAARKPGEAGTARHESRLYQNLLGDAWPRLAETVRTSHNSDTETRGIFAIRLGSNRLARLLARVSGLPKSGADVATLLKIETLRGIEHWQRYFGGHSLATRQWASKDGLLMECFNGWELGFALAEEEGALIYHQRRAHLRLGPMRLRAPLAIAPRVHAREQCAGKGRTTVEVIVTLPLIGILIVYSGELHTRDQANQ